MSYAAPFRPLGDAEKSYGTVLRSQLSTVASAESTSRRPTHDHDLPRSGLVQPTTSGLQVAESQLPKAAAPAGSPVDSTPWAPNIALQQTGSLVASLALHHPATRKVRAKPALRAGRPRC